MTLKYHTKGIDTSVITAYNVFQIKESLMTREKDKSHWIDNALIAHDFDLTSAQRIELLSTFYDAAFSAGRYDATIEAQSRIENALRRQAG